MNGDIERCKVAEFYALNRGWGWHSVSCICDSCKDFDLTAYSLHTLIRFPLLRLFRGKNDLDDYGILR